LTFATGLRSVLRADPDVIMVGEIRDSETARIGIEAALTGHMVLTTLHTNDAPLAAARLIEMGIEPYLVASGVVCVVAQRLVRRLCECKAEIELSKELLTEQGFDVDEGFTGYEKVGCVRCNHTGYKGRFGIYEVMQVSEGMRGLILQSGGADELRNLARSEGMRTLREDGLKKIQNGDTSVAEVLRVAGNSAR
jgi:type IV pilus assembly protein PilB